MNAHVIPPKPMGKGTIQYHDIRQFCKALNGYAGELTEYIKTRNWALQTNEADMVRCIITRMNYVILSLEALYEREFLKIPDGIDFQPYLSKIEEKINCLNAIGYDVQEVCNGLMYIDRVLENYIRVYHAVIRKPDVNPSLVDRIVSAFLNLFRK